MKNAPLGLCLLGAVYALGAASPAFAAEKLTIWHYFGGGAQKEVLDANNKAFADANPDVEIEPVFVPYDQMNQKLIASSAAGLTISSELPSPSGRVGQPSASS